MWFPLCAAANSQGSHRIFQIFEENTELQIAEGGSTVSDECKAIATSVEHRELY